MKHLQRFALCAFLGIVSALCILTGAPVSAQQAAYGPNNILFYPISAQLANSANIFALTLLLLFVIYLFWLPNQNDHNPH